MEVAVNSNFSALIIEGAPPDELLQRAWSDIQQQYADVMADLEYQHYLSKVKELAVLNVSLQQVQMAVQQLRILVPLRFANPDDPEFLDMINQYVDSLQLLVGKRYDFTSENHTTQLNDCLVRSKGIGLEIRLKEKVLEGIRKQLSEQGSEPTEEYYLNILISLSDHAGYHLTDQITVYEFCDRFRRMRDAVAKLKQPKPKR